MVAGLAADGVNLDDQAAFARSLEPLLPIAFRLAYAMVRRREEAEDVVQLAALKAWRKRGMFRPGAELRPWFLAIVANESRMALRRVRPEYPTTEAASEDPDAAAIQDLRRALAGLDAPSRMVLVLRYYLDLPNAEVARVLGVSEGAARVRVHRALARLRPAFDVAEDPSHG
jgi:RNA polymerase sigma-70 factor (ECF subfamily)